MFCITALHVCTCACLSGRVEEKKYACATLRIHASRWGAILSCLCFMSVHACVWLWLIPGYFHINMCVCVFLCVLSIKTVRSLQNDLFSSCFTDKGAIGTDWYLFALRKLIACKDMDESFSWLLSVSVVPVKTYHDLMLTVRNHKERKKEWR